MGDAHDSQDQPNAAWDADLESSESDVDDKDLDDIDVSDDAILQSMIELKGTESARDMLDLLHPSTWDSADPEVALLLGKVNALSESGHLTPDERCYVIHELIEPLCLDRGERNSERYVQVTKELNAYEDRARALSGDAFPWLDEDEEYRRLDADWHALLEAQEADFFAELGDPEVAELLRHDHVAFKRRLRAGEMSLCGSVWDKPLPRD